MAELPRGVTGEQLHAAFLRAGWLPVRQAGSHAILAHPRDPARHVLIPRHRTAVPVGTLAAIRRQSGYSAEAFRRLLQ